MKRFVGMMFVLLLVTLLAACSGGTKDTVSDPPVNNSNNQSTNQSNESGTKEPEELQPAEPVTIRYYTPTARTEEQFMEEYGNAIEEGMPHVTIDFIPAGSGTTIPELLTAGENIDIFYYSSGQIYSHLIEYGLEYDLNRLQLNFKKR